MLPPPGRALSMRLSKLEERRPLNTGAAAEAAAVSVAAASGSSGLFGLGTAATVGLVLATSAVLAGSGLGVAVAFGAFASSATPQPPLTPPPLQPPLTPPLSPSPPISPPPSQPPQLPPPLAPPMCPLTDTLTDNCTWFAPYGYTSSYYFSLLTESMGYEELAPLTVMNNNGLCDEYGGGVQWVVISRIRGFDCYYGHVIVCANGTDTTDCCNVTRVEQPPVYELNGFHESICGDYPVGDRGRRLTDDTANDTTNDTTPYLPPTIQLPLSFDTIKTILDDVAVVRIQLPQSVLDNFALIARAIKLVDANATGVTASTASSSGCLLTTGKSRVAGCAPLNQTACSNSYNELVAGRLASACTWDSGECARSAEWSEVC